MTTDQPAEPEDSKTRRKKAMTALQQLGERLLTCRPDKLASLPLGDPLRAAIAEYKRIPNSNEARRRHLQYIGRLMRGTDHEAIQAILDRDEVMDRQMFRRQQQLEAVCQRILDGGDEAISGLLDQFPQLDRQILRQTRLEYLRVKEPESLEVRTRLLAYLRREMAA